MPKRDEPLSEDMGRIARRFAVTGYLIQSAENGFDYTRERDELQDALEQEGPGLLIHPTRGEAFVRAGLYTMTESRARGGFCEIDMIFTEAGEDFPTRLRTDTQARVRTEAETTATTTATALDQGLVDT